VLSIIIALLAAIMEIDSIMPNNNEIERKCVKIEQSEKVDDNKMSTKMCNKFSIESILGLNSQNDDIAKSNRLDLIDFCSRKGEYGLMKDVEMI
jgi:hypothetical protein